MKELCTFSLDHKVSAHFSLFLTDKWWRLSNWNLKYKRWASRNTGIYHSASLYKMSLCLHLQNFLCISVTHVWLIQQHAWVTWIHGAVKFRVWEGLSLISSKQLVTFSFPYYYKSSICYYYDLLPNIGMAIVLSKSFLCQSCLASIECPGFVLRRIPRPERILWLINDVCLEYRIGTWKLMYVFVYLV